MAVTGAAQGWLASCQVHAVDEVPHGAALRRGWLVPLVVHVE